MSKLLLPTGIKEPKNIGGFWNGLDDIEAREFNATTDNSYALNSIPMPFARVKVVEQAFRIVAKEGIRAGNVFKRLVSDCLDIFEILYNYETYKEQIEIIHCTLDSLNFKKVNKINNKQESLFASAIKKYSQYNDMYFIVYNAPQQKIVLAATCPETLFFTTSRLDRSNKKMDYDGVLGDDFVFPKTSGKGTFFTRDHMEGRLLEERDVDFQQYMMHLYDENRETLNGTAIGKYLENIQVNNLGDNESRFYKPLQDQQQEPVTIKTGTGKTPLPILYNSKPKGSTVFTNYILDMGYELNGGKYKLMSGNNPLLKNCLLPLNLSSVAQMEDPRLFFKNTIDCDTIRVKCAGIDSHVERKISPVNLNLGVYPFFRFPDEYTNKRYYLTLGYAYEGYLDENAVECSFYAFKDDKLIPIGKYENGSSYGYTRELRSDTGKQRTIHYAIINSNFDLIEITIKAADEEYKGVLCPQLPPYERKQDKDILFAVDFGSTSSYVAVKKEEKQESGVFPLTTPEESLVYLHKGKNTDNVENSPIKYETHYEGAGFDKDVLALIRNEFLPSFIDGKVYQFPIRTAVSLKEGAENKQENIFNKINIAFTYEKESLVGNNEFEPNLKWDIKKQEETRVFIKELLIMAVNKALAEGYELNRIKFVRFKPLSLSESLELVINGVWKKCLEEMELPDAYDLTESYAPYHYYSSQFNDASTVATIDIGGGSVDFVLFSDKHPQYASSVLFGCDVIWGAGKSDEPGDKTNGIYTRLEKLVQLSSPDLKKIEADMKEKKSSYTSADIINFWITNDKQTGVIEKLMQPEYRPVYITHIAAILYHIAQTMKLKNITTPLTALAFSGNGSKYISLFKTKDKLRKITEMLFKEVFGEDGHVSPKLQVVLPEDLPEKLSGKQVTAHGGLKIDFTPENIEQMNNLENYVYVGAAPGKEKQWEKKRGQELLDNPQAITDICDNVINFLNCLNKIFDEILDNKPTFEKTDSGELRTSLLSIIDNLLDKDEKLKSSLFFLPLRQEIYKMTKQLKIKD